MPILFSKMNLITKNGNENCEDTTFRRVFCMLRHTNLLYKGAFIGYTVKTVSRKE